MKYTSLLAVSALALGAVLTSPALAEPVVLKFASAFPAGTKTNSETVPAFIEAVEEASEGTLKIEQYPGGTLGPNPQAQLKLVEDGVVDIAEVVAAYTPGRFPELEIFELPFTFNSTREASLTAWSLYDQGLLSGFDRIDLVGIAEVGPYYLHTSQSVADPADISGLKLRAGGPVQGSVVERLSGVAVGGIPATQIAENISRGVLDGSLMDMGNLYNFRIADATSHHVINVPLGNVAVMFPINKERYEGLPPKAKAAFDKYRGKWFTELLAENLDEQNAQTRAKLEDSADHELVEFSQEAIAGLEKTLAPLADPWKEEEEENGVNLYKKMIEARDAVRASQ